MVSRNIPKFHHYIPQFQLEYFTNNEGNVYLYDRVSKSYREQSPRRVGGITHYYAYVDDKGQKVIEIEDLNCQIEGIAATIIRKLHRGDDVDLNGQDKADLACFLALGWLRTPSAQERIEINMEAATKTMMRLQALDKDDFNKMIDRFEKGTGSKITDRDGQRDFVLKERYRIRYDRLASLQMMMSNLMPMTQAIQSMQWVVCRTAKKKFLLSDINFTVEQVEELPPGMGGGGLMSPGSQSMSVLTPELAIILRPKPGRTKFVNVDSKFVESSNVIYALRSRRLVISHSEAVLKRVVKTTKLATMPIPKHSVSVYSGPEGRSYRYESD